MRLTKTVLEKVLKDLDGETASTYYKSRNFEQNCIYKIQDGEMRVIRDGRTSWADSNFKEEELCNSETTRRVLHKYFL